jgi:hypothetical protein
MAPSETATLRLDLIASRYERARLKQSLVDALPALLLAAMIVTVQWRLTNQLVAAGLVVAGVACRWIGRRVGAGFGPGLLVAWVPLLLPTATEWLVGCDAMGSCTATCSAACAAGGLVAGVWLARLHARLGHHLVAWLVSAAIVGSASVAGCPCVGISTTLSFFATLAMAGAWGRVWFRARAAAAP